MANENKYTKEFLEPIVQKSKYWGELFQNLGIIQGGNNMKNIKKHIEKYNINVDHFISKSKALSLKRHKYALQYEDLFIEKCSHSRNSVKAFIYNNKLKPIVCELCGQNELWNNKKMSLILDHINGINNDNRLENLRLVCPNCNSTLDTHCRGVKYKKKYKNK